MVLKRGDRGEAVRQVQQALLALQFDVDVDGIFGKATEEAVKEFQRLNGLPDDGKVGPETLSALGVTEIDFGPEETEVPANVQERIEEYVTLLAQHHDVLLEKAQDALDNFETTMVFASVTEADPDALGAMLSKIFDFAVDTLFGRFGAILGPSLGLAKSLFATTSDELARAGVATASNTVGEWIQNQRVAIDVLRGTFDRGALQEEMELGFLEAADQAAFFDDLFTGISELRDAILPSMPELERRLYEQWVDAHFKGISDELPGCIEFRIKVEDALFVDESCTVQTPEGDKVASRLNDLIGALPGLERPMDLRVRKRACFFVENFVGGKSWSCGWFDHQNRLIHEPLHDDAVRAIQEQGWRISTTKFFN